MSKMQKNKKFTSSFGNEFTLQKVPAMTWLEITDKAQGAYGIKQTVLYPELLNNIVVEPQGLKVSSFDDEPYFGAAELKEVAEEAARFQLGK